jgi:hypothetical protein
VGRLERSVKGVIVEDRSLSACTLGVLKREMDVDVLRQSVVPDLFVFFGNKNILIPYSDYHLGNLGSVAKGFLILSLELHDEHDLLSEVCGCRSLLF